MNNDNEVFRILERNRRWNTDPTRDLMEYAYERHSTMGMTSDQFMTLIRTALNVGGGALVATGALTSNNVATITGIVIPVAAGIWGLFVHSPSQVVKAAEIVKEKGLA